VGRDIVGRAGENLTDECSTKWHLFSYFVGLMFGDMIDRKGTTLSKGEVHGSKHRRDGSVMGGVNKNGLGEGESDVARVKGSVDGIIEIRDRSLGQTGDKFLNPTDTLCADSRVSRAVSVPESQINTVFKTPPFLLGEQITKSRISKGNGLKRMFKISEGDKAIPGLPRRRILSAWQRDQG